MSKIPILVGDAHCNAAAMTQIINFYNERHYELYWLGDFINSKRENTDDREVEYVLHLMLEKCSNVLHSNHMHILFEYLHSVLFARTDELVQCHWKGWAQTKRVVDNLHPSAKRRLIDFIKNSRFMYEINFEGKKIAAAHAMPQPNTLFDVPSVTLTSEQILAIGIKSTRSFWRNKAYKELSNMYDVVVVGHHGLVSRFGNIRICDMRGHEIPTYDPSEDRFRIFPL